MSAHWHLHQHRPFWKLGAQELKRSGRDAQLGSRRIAVTVLVADGAHLRNETPQLSGRQPNLVHPTAFDECLRVHRAGMADEHQRASFERRS